MFAEPLPYRRLILFRPRPEFPLPPEWKERTWIPLGELRPLLQAVSPVRDLSDIWRWVALPLPGAEVAAALADVPGMEVRWESSNRSTDQVLSSGNGGCWERGRPARMPKRAG